MPGGAGVGWSTVGGTGAKLVSNHRTPHFQGCGHSWPVPAVHKDGATESKETLTQLLNSPVVEEATLNAHALSLCLCLSVCLRLSLLGKVLKGP